MSLTLAIDTTGRGGSVAVAGGGELLARIDHDSAQGYAESLLGLFDAVLERAGASRTDLGRVAVIEGPGSFTGLRVGVMTAKTLARARGWELWTANALELRLPPSTPGASVVATVEAGRGHVFAAHYRAENDQWSAGADIARVARADLETWAAERGARTVVASDGDRAASERLALAADVGRWPARAVDPRELIPLYTAPSQAERVHGLDLGEAIHRPGRPESWQ